MSASVVDWTALLLANFRGRRPRIAGRAGPAGTGVFRHHDWSALAARFALPEGVDYRNFRRVRRLLEAYLSRLSDGRPDDFATPDEQLAFYLNAYNAIAVYEALLHYPVASLRDIPAAFARPYPVGRENLSLHELLHAKIRAFGDPRIHAAVVPATRSAPPLRAYSGAGLQDELDTQMRAFAGAHSYVMHVDSAPPHVILPAVFRRFAGDFAAPERMPSIALLLRGQVQPSIALAHLRPYLPTHVIAALDDGKARLRFSTYDWNLNDIEG